MEQSRFWEAGGDGGYGMKNVITCAKFYLPYFYPSPPQASKGKLCRVFSKVE
jgi:hypothetical protein